MRLAVLTCLARMLEIKCAGLEEEGTGPLEQDQAILEAAKNPEGQPSPASRGQLPLHVYYTECLLAIRQRFVSVRLSCTIGVMLLIVLHDRQRVTSRGPWIHMV